MKDGDFPAIYRASDDLSQSAQTHFYRALLGHLALLIVAAILSVAYDKQSWVALVQALVLLATFAISIYLATTRPEKTWYGARAVAESVKTLTWRYVMRAEPFDQNDVDSNARFLSTLSQVLSQNKEIAGKLTFNIEGDQLTAQMTSLRASSLARRKDVYLEGRINDQKAWYANKSRANRKLGTVFFCLLIGSNAIAAILAVVRILQPDTEHWPTDIFLASSGSILAWIQSKRFGELAASYALAANEIGIIKEQLRVIVVEQDFSGYVGDAENAFSREHTQWVARKDV